jgi:hypothetical protein
MEGRYQTQDSRPQTYGSRGERTKEFLVFSFEFLVEEPPLAEKNKKTADRM